MDILINWSVGVIVLLQVPKMIFSWTLHNMLHPNQRVDFGVNHPGRAFQKNGLERKRELDFMFIYCAFIMFWTKIPEQKSGKIMVWCVHIISVIQVIGISLLAMLKKGVL